MFLKTNVINQDDNTPVEKKSPNLLLSYGNIKLKCFSLLKSFKLIMCAIK